MEMYRSSWQQVTTKHLVLVAVESTNSFVESTNSFVESTNSFVESCVKTGQQLLLDCSSSWKIDPKYSSCQIVPLQMLECSKEL
jgi:hypothetical protein